IAIEWFGERSTERHLNTRRRKNFLLLGTHSGGHSRLHIECRQLNEPLRLSPLDLLPRRGALLLERTPGKRRSGRRLFQKTWPINLEGFPASAYAPTNPEDAGLSASGFPRIKCRRDGAECPRRITKAC